MADERTYFVICADNCKFEGMTKEQILTAIEQAVSTGTITDVDTGFITKIKEQNGGKGLTFWVGTNAEYNAIETKAENCFYIITDDTTGDDIDAAITEMRGNIEELQTGLNTVKAETIAKRGVLLFDGQEGENTIRKYSGEDETKTINVAACNYSVVSVWALGFRPILCNVTQGTHNIEDGTTINTIEINGSGVGMLTSDSNLSTAFISLSFRSDTGALFENMSQSLVFTSGTSERTPTLLSGSGIMIGDIVGIY